MPQTFLGQPPYDQPDAHDYVLGRVEAPAEQVRQVLGAQARYHALVGIVSADQLPEEERAGLKDDRQAHRDLLPYSKGRVWPVCEWGFEAEYVRWTTGLPLMTVTDILVQELGYQVSMRMTAPVVFEEYRQFSRWVLHHN